MQSFGKAPRFARLDGRPSFLAGQKYAEDRRTLRAAKVTATAPSQIGTRLVGWWSADAGVSPGTDGVGVSQWNDRSLAWPLTQATASYMPVYHASGPNGKPFITFDGIDDYLEVTGPQGIWKSPCTIIMVTSDPTQSAAFNLFYDYNQESVFPYLNKACHESNYNVWCARNHQTTASAGWALQTFWFGSDPYDTQYWLKGVASTQGFIKGNTPGTFAGGARWVLLGCRSDNSNWFTGSMAELCIYGAALSDRERLGVEAYLAAKYGLT